ncbi:hypothetical protein [Pseudovibrio sp. FO-BEG1]|uniref:hypothetical protein n=1 Tax=Pseudovibrio sp. (strain FO-BEG1) TaxID=911045 RepID=UPI000687FCB3|nr:hypothetical protein [Pseudovibrio sp. FO-BEG1]
MLRNLSYELSRGLAYRKIQHPEMSRYKTVLPLALSTLTTLAITLAPIAPLLIGKDSLSKELIPLISILPGFYFAGLAAVATFGAEQMDRVLPHPAPTLKIGYIDQEDIQLSKRQFMSYLFSYLVLISLFLCLSLIFFNVFNGSILHILKAIKDICYGKEIIFVIKLVTIFTYSFLFSSLAVTTLHGIFFLTEKIHQP